MNQSTVMFSIIIPTLNEENYLPLLLQDLANQTYKNFKVIIVDGNSTDQTIKKTKEFKNKLVINTISTKVKNISYQRNLGTKKVTTKWIIFMDADNRLPTNFLQNITQQIKKNSNLDIFTTLIKSQNKLIELWSNFWLILRSTLKLKAGFGALIGVKTSIAKQYPFDQTQLVMEDVIFIQNIVNSNYNFKVLHQPRYTFSLRRINRDKFFKTLITSISIAFHYYILNQDFKTNNFNYEMKGGGEY